MALEGDLLRFLSFPKIPVVKAEENSLVLAQNMPPVVVE
jgi:hypothetical protein